MLILLFYVLTTIQCILIPPIRHYDFVGSHHVVTGPKLRLLLSAFNQTFVLELERNQELIFENTKLLVQNANGDFEAQNLVAHPYKGSTLSVTSQVYSYQELMAIESNRLLANDLLLDNVNEHKVGWARILFHQDPFQVDSTDLMFEGVFSVKQGTQNVLHHISTVENYRLSKREVDVDVASPMSRPAVHRRANMIIFRDSEPSSDFVKRDGVHHSSFDPVSLLDDYGCPVEPNSAYYDAAKELQRRLGVDVLQNPLFYEHKENERLQRRASASCALPNKKLLPMGAAADCSYTNAYGSSGAALTKMLSNWNSASQVYEDTFNVGLALVEVKIMTSCGDAGGQTLNWNKECSTDYTINNRLSDFSSWRGKYGGSTNGLWHLMTKCSTGPSVGIAWVSTLCSADAVQQGSDVVSGTGVSSIVPVEWKVVAHEVGHNFGAIHDCISVQCPTSCLGVSSNCVCCPCDSQCDCNGQYLMHPTDNSQLDQFSPCSIRFMCSNIPTASCFKDASDLKVLSAGICGNGVKEGSEDCDCGANCSNDNCCDGTTCKFKNNAKCDDQNDECCSQCQLMKNGTLCRASNDMCSLSQYCDGASGMCPKTKTLDDGTSCASQNGTGTTCASGVCTSRDLQCQSLITVGTYATVRQCAGQDSQCGLLCETASGVCLSLNGYFIDGTPCAGGGFCRGGQCTGASLWGTIINYFNTQPQLAIPIAVIIGLIILWILYCAIKSCCACAKRRPSFLPQRHSTVVPPRPVSTANPPGSTWVDPSTYNGSAQPLHNLPQQNPSQVSSRWVDPAIYNGTRDAAVAEEFIPQEPHESTYALLNGERDSQWQIPRNQ